jgi:hypothetical protein
MGDWENSFKARREATRSLLDLYDQAKRCQELLDKSGIPAPDGLKIFLGMSEQSGKSKQNRQAATVAALARRVATHVAPVAAPSYSRPGEATDEWISIDIADASTIAVVLAILRRNGVMKFRDLVEAVQEVRPDTVAGSVANVGYVRQGSIVERTAKGWKLLSPREAGIIANGRFWAPHSILSLQELAAHRREAILLILKHYQALATVELADVLEQCSSWMRARVNQYLVKDDTVVLKHQKKIRHRGNTRQWELC